LKDEIKANSKVHFSYQDSQFKMISSN